MVESPRLAGVDEALGEQGWKIVALLRLSPVPFNPQNSLYGVMAVGFRPCVLASWVAMLPGTFTYVYLGSLGRAVASGRDTSLALCGLDLLATIAATVYVARLARNATRQRTRIEEGEGERTP